MHSGMILAIQTLPILQIFGEFGKDITKLCLYRTQHSSRGREVALKLAVLPKNPPLWLGVHGRKCLSFTRQNASFARVKRLVNFTDADMVILENRCQR